MEAEVPLLRPITSVGKTDLVENLSELEEVLASEKLTAYDTHQIKQLVETIRSILQTEAEKPPFNSF